MKYFSLANVLQVALYASVVTATINIEKRGDFVTVTAKGTMTKDGKFTPFTPAQEAEQDRADDLARAQAKKTPRYAEPSNEVQSLHERSAEPSSEVSTFHERRLARAAPSDVIEKRQFAEAIIAVLFGPIGAAMVITTAALVIGTLAITSLVNWTETREKFTRATTTAMMEKIAENATMAALAPGAFCYNKAWDSLNPAHIGAKQSKDLTSFPLSTTYDCAFIIAPNTVYTRGDGGFINVS